MEESVNFVKGYNKINPSDGELKAVTFPSKSPTRRTTVTVTVTLTIAAIIIIILIIIAAVATTTTFHHRHTKPSQPNQSPSLKSSESIKTVCAVTQNPNTCFTDIVSVNSVNAVDPVTIFNLTLQLTVTELTNVSSLPKTLISNSNDLRTGGALRDCANLFDDAVSQLGRTVELMSGGELTLTVEKVGDMMTWISGAMTDLDTCVDGLEEMRSTAVDEVKMRVQRSNVCMSNSLAILSHMEDIFNKFGLHLH